jgi:two-component system cell cycle response regulator
MLLPTRSTGWLVTIVVASLALIFKLDASTGAAPFQHLYYVPIILAGLGLARYSALLVSFAAIVLYHLANPTLLNANYKESDIVQIALYLATGIVTAKLAEDGRRFRRLAVTDDLTELYNLRGFEERLKVAIRSARETNTPIAMLVTDLDKLKALNDSHGHLAGADAVRTVGRLVGAHLPEDAFACRFGGDEFVIALPGQDLHAASATAENLRHAVEAAAPTLAEIPFPAGTLSVSIGLACLPHVIELMSRPAASDAEIGEALFQTADRALYVAKAAGRNRVRAA